MKREIPDKNLFMMCEHPNAQAFSELPKGYYVRNCRREELDIWKSMPFDTPELAEAYYGYMTDFFNEIYGSNMDLFLKKCLFVCDKDDKPIGTCFIWKVYGSINTLHWLKVLQGHEGLGIGRALLSIVLNELMLEDYPVYLHTQPSSYRAIKLYSDFGFALLSDPVIGYRQNDLEECLPILKEYMPPEDFEKLKIVRAPERFLKVALSSKINQF